VATSLDSGTLNPFVRPKTVTSAGRFPRPEPIPSPQQPMTTTATPAYYSLWYRPDAKKPWLPLRKTATHFDAVLWIGIAYGDGDWLVLPKDKFPARTLKQQEDDRKAGLP